MGTFHYFLIVMNKKSRTGGQVPRPNDWYLNIKKGAIKLPFSISTIYATFKLPSPMSYSVNQLQSLQGFYRAFPADI